MITVGVSCALQGCYYSNAKHTSKGLYLPILTNERTRMIGQARADAPGMAYTIGILPFRQALEEPKGLPLTA
uniref:Uncharacterized protein n=1 Tax=Utricularia reniformis TaxID=192314 RepID=A0A1Y0B1X4_9LAMI|nr:hypothetical protein AEK19_MT1159 [Utricularia reniformis]ART31373.1 hypothetical protein AEK19_MT1159 [Utricularia reniformis]